ncbi:MAG: SH3 domain-containing protein [Desulfobacterales bacterium]|nr:SH3 domain-containing protein [Desulfobacterales bacterium]MDD4070958.1 SH3 domain-containing protein [Desulfobacterales bacterium]MDD4393416.1 SH3 domain-containing protein [Desulfobacterales bacterium]
MRRRYFFNLKLVLIISCLLLMLSTTALAERLSVKEATANIRSGPGTTYDILWRVEKFYPLVILKKSGNWYLFSDFEGDEGWINEALVSSVASVIVKKDHCNVRSGAGTGSTVVFTVDKGVPFKVLQRKDSWLHIQHADGDQGWIHASLVW